MFQLFGIVLLSGCQVVLQFLWAVARAASGRVCDRAREASPKLSVCKLKLVKRSIMMYVLECVSITLVLKL